MAIESFIWGKHFITELPEIDHQHQYIVKIINNFSCHLVENNVPYSQVEELLQDLTGYSVYHFKTEEKMMAETGVDFRHMSLHQEIHNEFLADVTSIIGSISPQNMARANDLLDFLTHWLAYHILGTDQNMARQIKAIQAGATPSEAYELEEMNSEASTEPLLKALNGLFKQVSQRNRQLTILYETLEAKVLDRTEALSAANSYLEGLSITDSLTGLYNRRYALQGLRTIWEQSNKNNTPLVCMMVDADNFKPVNDTYGHDAGDRVLKTLGQSLKSFARHDDLVCRLGGDEFLIICPDTTRQEGLRLAEDIIKKVSEIQIETGDDFWKSSVSIGLSVNSPEIMTYENLIKLADNGVYEAKRDGRNCVRSIQVRINRFSSHC